MGLLAKITGKTRTKETTTDVGKAANKPHFRGVEIVAKDLECCQAAKDLKQRRFLSDEVPMLPLKDCDSSECRCSYRRFDDRRTELRRISDVGFDITSQFRQDDDRDGVRPGRRQND